MRPVVLHFRREANDTPLCNQHRAKRNFAVRPSEVTCALCRRRLRELLQQPVRTVGVRPGAGR
jgi:hypothetical protein